MFSLPTVNEAVTVEVAHLGRFVIAKITAHNFGLFDGGGGATFCGTFYSRIVFFLVADHKSGLDSLVGTLATLQEVNLVGKNVFCGLVVLKMFFILGPEKTQITGK